MLDSPDPPAASHSSTGKRKRSEQGWAARKARDARQQAEHYEGRKALASPSYTLGMVDDLQTRVHLTPLVSEKFAAASFERYRGWLVRSLQAKWPATALVRINANKPQGGPLGLRSVAHPAWGTRAQEPFLNVTASNYATTQQRPFLRGKTRLIHEVREQLGKRSPFQHNGLHNDLDISRKMHRLLTP